MVLLGQSDSIPEPLQVSESQLDYDQPLKDVKDTSPEVLSSEESSKRLKQLQDAQKQGTSLADNPI